FSSRRRHTRSDRDWSSDVCSSDLPIDVKVKLFDGQEVDGPSELRAALLRYSPQFVRMFIEKMMTYALGRGLEYTDMPTVRAIARSEERRVGKEGEWRWGRGRGSEH